MVLYIYRPLMKLREGNVFRTWVCLSFCSHKVERGPMWSLPGPIQTCSLRDPLPHLTIQWTPDHARTPLPGPSRHVQTWTSPYRTPPLHHSTICSLGPHRAGTPQFLTPAPTPRTGWKEGGWPSTERPSCQYCYQGLFGTLFHYCVDIRIKKWDMVCDWCLQCLYLCEIIVHCSLGVLLYKSPLYNLK